MSFTLSSSDDELNSTTDDNGINCKPGEMYKMVVNGHNIKKVKFAKLYPLSFTDNGAENDFFFLQSDRADNNEINCQSSIELDFSTSQVQVSAMWRAPRSKFTGKIILEALIIYSNNIKEIRRIAVHLAHEQSRYGGFVDVSWC